MGKLNYQDGPDEENHVRFFIHLRMDCSTVCGGIDDSCWAVGAGIDCCAVGAGIDGSCRVANCLGAPLVGVRGFLGRRPLLFGMESSIIKKEERRLLQGKSRFRQPTTH